VVTDAPDQQIPLTDSDARSMAASGKGTRDVGYNVQTAVDAQHLLIVVHAVTSVGNDRGPARNGGEAGANPGPAMAMAA
jgi:hypothetical protein